jgi:predicted DsbA family dithiol-disulfide isomerase
MPARLELDLYVSPYCPRCESVLEDLASLQTVRGRSVTIRKRDVLEHLDSAVAAGVHSTSAFVLGGRLLASGRLTPERLRKILQGVPSGEHHHGPHDQ